MQPWCVCWVHDLHIQQLAGKPCIVDMSAIVNSPLHPQWSITCFSHCLTTWEVYAFVLPVLILLTYLPSFKLLAYAAYIGSIFLAVAMIVCHFCLSVFMKKMCNNCSVLLTMCRLSMYMVEMVSWPCVKTKCSTYHQTGMALLSGLVSQPSCSVFTAW